MIFVTDILKDLKTKQLADIKSLAVLLDPDKIEVDNLKLWLTKIPRETDYIFVGGSEVEKGKTDKIVRTLKKLTPLSIILFPGDVNQITTHADALLFLSLMSGDNPEYLIHQQVKSVKFLKNTQLEIIPTAYILIDGGKTCTTERVTNTSAISQAEIQNIADITLAAQYAGKQLVYLEAGSGAIFPVSTEIIKEVRKVVEIPIIVGGGIRSKKQKQSAYNAGADMVVMGTVFEE